MEPECNQVNKCNKLFEDLNNLFKENISGQEVNSVCMSYLCAFNLHNDIDPDSFRFFLYGSIDEYRRRYEERKKEDE